jgi:hypothetical protein
MSNEELLKRRLCDIRWHEPANRRIMQFYGRRNHWGEKFGAETLGELVRFTPEEVGEWPNIGPATLAAIVATLKEMGISLGQPKSGKPAVEAQLRFPGSSAACLLSLHPPNDQIPLPRDAVLVLPDAGDGQRGLRAADQSPLRFCSSACSSRPMPLNEPYFIGTVPPLLN